MNKHHEIIYIKEKNIRIDVFISDIKKNSKPPGKRISAKRYVDLMIDRVGRDVCRALDMKFEDLIGSSQKQDFNRARHIFFYVCRRIIPEKTYDQLARAVGRCYSTAIHGVNNVKDYLEIQRSDFMPTWEKYLQNTTLYSHE